MKRFYPIFLAFLTLMALPACAGSPIPGPAIGPGYHGTYRYKMTVCVDTPEGQKCGSAVREVFARDSTQQVVPGIGKGGCVTSVKGEAVVVDLGQRGKLFALLKDGRGSTDMAADLPAYTFPILGSPGGCLKDNIKHYENLEAKGPVDLQFHPLMVAFKDMTDPTSVQYVYGVEEYNEKSPGGGYDRLWRVKEDNFEKLFGKGVKLNSVTLEMTDEPVTRGVLKQLPSFNDSKHYMEWFNSLKYGNPLQVGPSDYYKK